MKKKQIGNTNVRFAVARIKKLIQKDEDVGKVAAVTPYLISKALELFLIDLSDKVIAKCQQQHTHRLHAIYLYV